MNPRLILFLLFAISAGAQNQILFSAWFLELPPKMADKIEKQADKADDKTAFYEALLQSPHAEMDLLSAPRVITLPGQSAEIKIVTELFFMSGLEQDDAGDWLPKFETRELGISMLVMAAPQPANPRRLTGAFESTVSELISKKEELIPIPGQEPITLTIPVIQERKLTAGFVAQSGETMLMGRADRAGKAVFVLMRVEVKGTGLAERLSEVLIPRLELRDTPLDDALTFLRL
ncbi:MAG: hypothetical protein ACI8W8_002506 [Rhodothermales bacterium]|jgi:hypothetical protein